MRHIAMLFLIACLYQKGFSQQQQNQNLNFQASPNQNFSSTNQQTQNNSQPMQTFTTPNLLEGYRFGSFSPFSNYQQLSGAQSLPSSNMSSATKPTLPPMKLGGLRAKISIDINVYYPTAIEKENIIKTRISRINFLSNTSDVHVDVDDKIAVITGEIDSMYELFLLQNLISLEPGIDKVIDKTKLKK